MPHTPPPTGNWLNCSIQHDHSMLPYCTASVYRIFCVRLDILCVLFSCVLAPCKATCVENSHHSWIMQVHVPPSASPARGICRVNLSSQIRTLLYRVSSRTVVATAIGITITHAFRNTDIPDHNALCACINGRALASMQYSSPPFVQPSCTSAISATRLPLGGSAMMWVLLDWCDHDEKRFAPRLGTVAGPAATLSSRLRP